MQAGRQTGPGLAALDDGDGHVPALHLGRLDDGVHRREDPQGADDDGHDEHEDRKAHVALLQTTAGPDVVCWFRSFVRLLEKRK